METHFYTMELFSLTCSLSYEHSEKTNETALGINTKNVVSEMETICKLYKYLSCGKTTPLVPVWEGGCACAHTDASMD